MYIYNAFKIRMQRVHCNYIFILYFHYIHWDISNLT